MTPYHAQDHHDFLLESEMSKSVFESWRNSCEATGERRGLLEARKFARQELNNPLSARDYSTKAAIITIIGRINRRLDEISEEGNT